MCEQISNEGEEQESVEVDSSFVGAGQFATSSNSSLVAFPLSHIHVNSKFGMRFHPVYHKQMLHNGIDLQARYEPVYSIFPGRVIRIGYDNRSGNFITIQSADYTIIYCHLSKIIVKQGGFIEAGTPIAISGNSGASTGPHLHLTVKNNGKAVNPAIILNFVNLMQENPVAQVISLSDTAQ